MKFRIPLTIVALAAISGQAMAGTEVTQSEISLSGEQAPLMLAEAESSGVMDKPLDGSSLESFEDGLAQVKAEADKEDYDKLNRAMVYLLNYDLGARRDKATLYGRLDGMSPTQIIEKVEKRYGAKL